MEWLKHHSIGQVQLPKEIQLPQLVLVHTPLFKVLHTRLQLLLPFRMEGWMEILRMTKLLSIL